MVKHGKQSSSVFFKWRFYESKQLLQSLWWNFIMNEHEVIANLFDFLMASFTPWRQHDWKISHQQYYCPRANEAIMPFVLIV